MKYVLMFTRTCLVVGVLGMAYAHWHIGLLETAILRSKELELALLREQECYMSGSTVCRAPRAELAAYDAAFLRAVGQAEFDRIRHEESPRHAAE
jgi:hypothetical protein